MALGILLFGVVAVQLVGILSIVIFGSCVMRVMLSVALLPLVALSFSVLLVALVLVKQVDRAGSVVCLGVGMSFSVGYSIGLVLGDKLRWLWRCLIQGMCCFVKALIVMVAIGGRARCWRGERLCHAEGEKEQWDGEGWDRKNEKE